MDYSAQTRSRLSRHSRKIAHEVYGDIYGKINRSVMKNWPEAPSALPPSDEAYEAFVRKYQPALDAEQVVDEHGGYGIVSEGALQLQRGGAGGAAGVLPMEPERDQHSGSDECHAVDPAVGADDRLTTPEMARDMGLDRQILNQLIRDAAFTAQARNLGLAVPNRAVVSRIAANPNYQNAQGEFDPQDFRRLLAANGLSEGEFIASQHGLGRAILYASQVYDIALIWVGVIILSVLAVLMYVAVAWLERVLLRGFMHGANFQ